MLQSCCLLQMFWQLLVLCGCLVRELGVFIIITRLCDRTTSRSFFTVFHQADNKNYKLLLVQWFNNYVQMEFKILGVNDIILYSWPFCEWSCDSRVLNHSCAFLYYIYSGSTVVYLLWNPYYNGHVWIRDDDGWQWWWDDECYWYVCMPLLLHQLYIYNYGFHTPWCNFCRPL